MNAKISGWIDYVINDEFYQFYGEKSTKRDRLDAAQLKIFRAMWKRWALNNANNALSILAVANPLSFRLPGAGRPNALKKPLQWQIYKGAIDYAIDHGACDARSLAYIIYDVIEQAKEEYNITPILLFGGAKVSEAEEKDSSYYYITDDKVERFRSDWNIGCIGKKKTAGDVNEFIDMMIPVWMETMIVQDLLKPQFSSLSLLICPIAIWHIFYCFFVSFFFFVSVFDWSDTIAILIKVVVQLMLAQVGYLRQDQFNLYQEIQNDKERNK